MTPKELAEELVNKYYNLFCINLENSISIYESKQCALIAVKEILFVVKQYNDTQLEFIYWQEVENEIEKL